MSLKDILEFNFINIGDIHLNLAHILMAVLILTIARFGIWLIGRLLDRYFHVFVDLESTETFYAFKK